LITTNSLLPASAALLPRVPLLLLLLPRVPLLLLLRLGLESEGDCWLLRPEPL
jgi:hypothetical protein